MKVISQDTHCGWTGRTSHNNLYRVTLGDFQGPVTLRCYFWTPRDSYGKLFLRKLPDGQTKEIATWEERSTDNRVWVTNNIGGNQGLNGTIRSKVESAQIDSVDYDITRLLDGHGTYEVEFRYVTPNPQGEPVLNGTYIKGVELGCPEQNPEGVGSPVESQSHPHWAWFAVGCVLLVAAIAFAVWGFGLRQLSEDQRRILLWVLPLASGVAAGTFAGSMSVRAQKFLPGLVITAAGGFGVWLLTFFFLFAKHSRSLSINQNGPESILREAGGLLVDIDPIRLQWTATGKEEMVNLFLENVDSQKGSPRKRVPSNVHSVEFDRGEVLSVATNRRFHGKKRSSAVQRYENSRNPDPERRRFVERVFGLCEVNQVMNNDIQSRAATLAQAGVKPLDALHLASAQAASAEYFLTCDDRLPRRYAGPLSVLNPVDFVLKLSEQT